MSRIERMEMDENVSPEKEIREQRKEAEYLSDENISEEDMERLLSETEDNASEDGGKGKSIVVICHETLENGKESEEIPFGFRMMKTCRESPIRKKKHGLK